MYGFGDWAEDLELDQRELTHKYNLRYEESIKDIKELTPIMLTAQKAKELAGPSPKDRVYALDSYIRKAVAEKSFCLKVGKDCLTEDSFWRFDGQGRGTSAWNEAKRILVGLGYKVEYVQEHGDHYYWAAYTKISWD